MNRQNGSVLFTLLLLFTIICVACGGSPTEQASSTAQASPTPTTQTTPQTTTVPVSGQETYDIVAPPTEASYQVQEQFLSKSLPSQAVGKTNSVKGNFSLVPGDKPAIKAMSITVDLRTLKSDREQRDTKIQDQWLESKTYPYATFNAKDVQTIPAGSGDGQTVNFAITGDMTIRNVTRQETFQVTGKLAGDTISGTATAKILMKNYNFDPPSISGILTVMDGVTVTINFTAKKAQS